MSALAEKFNPTPKSDGFVLYEHWQTDGRGQFLLLVSSSPVGMKLEPGDTIVARTWAPAGPPVIENEAREGS